MAASNPPKFLVFVFITWQIFQIVVVGYMLCLNHRLNRTIKAQNYKNRFVTAISTDIKIRLFTFLFPTFVYNPRNNDLLLLVEYS